MASLQARHSRSCELGVPWTTVVAATNHEGGTCAPLCHVVNHHGAKLIGQVVGHNRREAARARRTPRRPRPAHLPARARGPLRRVWRSCDAAEAREGRLLYGRGALAQAIFFAPLLEDRRVSHGDRLSIHDWPRLAYPPGEVCDQLRGLGNCASCGSSEATP